jgi:parvulin-like peptidyl-prolyl isomerase
MEKGKKGKGGKDTKGKDTKGKSDEKDDMKTCNFVKAKHILCEKLSKIEEVKKIIFDSFGGNPTPSQFGKLAEEHSECTSKKRGGDLGYFQRTQMVGAFSEAAFATPIGQMTDIVRTKNGYHLILVEDRKMNVK